MTNLTNFNWDKYPVCPRNSNILPAPSHQRHAGWQEGKHAPTVAACRGRQAKWVLTMTDRKHTVSIWSTAHCHLLPSARHVHSCTGGIQSQRSAAPMSNQRTSHDGSSWSRSLWELPGKRTPCHPMSSSSCPWGSQWADWKNDPAPRAYVPQVGTGTPKLSGS